MFFYASFAPWMTAFIFDDIFSLDLVVFSPGLLSLFLLSVFSWTRLFTQLLRFFFSDVELTFTLHSLLVGYFEFPVKTTTTRNYTLVSTCIRWLRVIVALWKHSVISTVTTTQRTSVKRIIKYNPNHRYNHYNRER